MKLNWPIKNIGFAPGIAITQRFGEHLNDYSQFGLKGHNGIDISAPLGTPIIAPHDGKVFYQKDLNPDGTFKGYGNYARLYFDEEGFTWELTFGHQQKFEGTDRWVEKGDVLGYVNSTGFSTGNHCHYGMRQLLNGVIQNADNGYNGSIDPMPFMKIIEPKWVGYKKSPQKDMLLEFPDIPTAEGIKSGAIMLYELYEFSDYEKSTGLDKPINF